MADFLAEMRRSSVRRAGKVDPSRFPRPASPLRVLRDGPFEVFAEVKRRSPSLGALAEGVDVAARARAYQHAGATAISVLTEPTRFGGSLADLSAVTAAVDIPVMRKDFVVDPVQLAEARALGASGALLVVAMLDDDALPRMVDAAAELGLFVLLEAFDRPDLERIAGVLDRGATARVGVNCRNLRTLSVEPARFAALAEHVPEPAIAESGLHRDADVEAVRSLGYRGILVGTALMQSPDPGACLRRWTCS